MQTKDDFENKYWEEKKKYDNLLRMQKTILTDTDDYIAALAIIKTAIEKRERIEPDNSQEIGTEEAFVIAQKAAELIKQDQRQCECERWKKLYQHESKESARISLQKEELAGKLIAKEKEEQLDRIEIGKLLQDYLDLYKKDVRGEVQVGRVEPQMKKGEKKEARSRSKGGQPQTQRKGGKPLLSSEESKDGHVKWVLQRWQKQCLVLQSELERVRKQLLEKEQLLLLYRSKQRKHLLAGGELLD